MKVLIVDDEVPARELIKKYLQDIEGFELIGEASNGFEGYKLITKLNPDVVFLDISMPKLNGFELLELLEQKPSVIFCTAYDEYAIKAFEQNAIDYLLKPFSKTRFKEALTKVKERKGVISSKHSSRITFNHPLTRIVVKNDRSIDIVPVETIDYLMSQDDYVEIITSKGKYLKQERLKYYESALDRSKFVRVHRQYILNVNRLVKLDKFGKESYLALLKNGEQITVSASGYLRLKEALGI